MGSAGASGPSACVADGRRRIGTCSSLGMSAGIAVRQ